MYSLTLSIVIEDIRFYLRFLAIFQTFCKILSKIFIARLAGCVRYRAKKTLMYVAFLKSAAGHIEMLSSGFWYSLSLQQVDHLPSPSCVIILLSPTFFISLWIVDDSFDLCCQNIRLVMLVWIMPLIQRIMAMLLPELSCLFITIRCEKQRKANFLWFFFKTRLFKKH